VSRFPGHLSADQIDPAAPARMLANMSGPDPRTGCRRWLRSVRSKKKGYGAVYVKLCGRRVMLYAHRVSFALFVGPIPAGMTVNHRCCNPRCVEPSHLEIATPDEQRARLAKPSTPPRARLDFTPRLPRPMVQPEEPPAPF
jgi:hypothetical protein